MSKVNNPYQGYSVTFPNPWTIIRKPEIRLTLGNPEDLVFGLTVKCIPVYTLSKDDVLSSRVRSYAHYFHTCSGRDCPDVQVAYLSVPRFILAMRTYPLFRNLVLSAPINISEG